MTQASNRRGGIDWYFRTTFVRHHHMNCFGIHLWQTPRVHKYPPRREVRRTNCVSQWPWTIEHIEQQTKNPKKYNLRSAQITWDHLKSYQISSDQLRSLLDQIRSPEITAYQPRTHQMSLDHPTGAQTICTCSGRCTVNQVPARRIRRDYRTQKYTSKS